MFALDEQNKKVSIITLVKAQLPRKGTDAPEASAPAASGSGDRSPYFRNRFDRYKEGIMEFIREAGGETSLQKVGQHLNKQVGYKERFREAATGKDGGMTKILPALGFVLKNVGTGSVRVVKPR